MRELEDPSWNQSYKRKAKRQTQVHQLSSQRMLMSCLKQVSSYKVATNKSGYILSPVDHITLKYSLYRKEVRPWDRNIWADLLKKHEPTDLFDPFNVTQVIPLFTVEKGPPFSEK